MRKLLSANFYRMFRSKIYWFSMLFMFGFGLVAIIRRVCDVMKYSDYAYQTADGLWFVGVICGVIVMAIFISIWVGTDYSDGTIRNKLIVGRTRSEIYLSNWIVCTIASIMMHLTYIFVVAILGNLLLEKMVTPAKTLIIATLISCLAIVAFVSLFLMVAMLIHTKATSAITTMIVALLLLTSAMTVFNMLEEPEYIEPAYEVMVDGEVIPQDRKINPKYLSGAKREFYQFILDVSPEGQMIQLGKDMYMTFPENMEYFPIYSLLIICITNACGMKCFYKKDLK